MFLHSVHGDLGLADEEGLERAGRVVPPEALPVSVPHLEAVLLFAVLVPETTMRAREYVFTHSIFDRRRSHPHVFNLHTNDYSKLIFLFKSQ